VNQVERKQASLQTAGEGRHVRKIRSHDLGAGIFSPTSAWRLGDAP
jgi:hypothetical protein